MNKTIDSKAGFGRRSGMSLIELMVCGTIVSVVAAVGIPTLTRKTLTAVYSEKFVNEVTGVKVEKPAIRFESYQVQQLADSAIRRYTGLKRDSERYRMDKNQDGLITEDEVIGYVRAK